MTYPFGNDPAKIEGYRRWWKRAPVNRPLVGFSLKTWFPMHEFAASRAWREHQWLTPDMIHPADFVEDQERLLREGELLDDDVLRGACPSQAVMWLPPTMGARLRILDESTLATDMHLTWDEVDRLEQDPDGPWFPKYLEFVQVLVDASAGRYPVSHGTMSGPSDVAAILRGHDNLINDFFDAPERVRDLCFRTMEAFCALRDAQWAITPLWHGGYFDAQYSLWAPGPIIRMQEDATGLYSPKLYRELLQPVDREWASRYECAFIHLHSTSNFVLDAILEVDEIAAYEYNRDVSGPPLREMIPYYAMIQDAEKPLLIRGSFTADELSLLQDYLDSRGLYLYIMVSSLEETEPLRRVLGM